MAIGRNNMYVRPGTLGLLYIEPKLPASREPIDDEATAKMESAMRRAKEGTAWRGFHTCGCGVMGGGVDYVIDGRFTTNRLAVHYLRFHRGEVPPGELEDVLSLPSPAKPLTERLVEEFLERQRKERI